MLFKKEKEIPLFIGYYKLSVLLTYMSVFSACIGIYLALAGEISYALICLIICGVCDAFDGKVARSCKRDKQEEAFGIQIDSLADTIAFVCFPVIIFYGIGLVNWYNIAIFALFLLAGIIRLGYFNVMADLKVSSGGVKYYSGLPVTSSAIIFPLVYLVHNFVSFSEFSVIYTLTMFFVAILFVLNFKLRKPKTIWLYVFVIFAIIVSILLHFGGLR